MNMLLYICDYALEFAIIRAVGFHIDSTHAYARNKRNSGA